VAVNRTELIEKVAGTTSLDKRQVETALGALADSVMGEIKAGNKVTIFGFGTFQPTSRAARTGRNPQTGAPVKIAASKGVRFSPATAFKAALNTRGGAKKAATKKAAPAKKAAARKVAPVKKAPAAKVGAARKAAPAKKATKTAKTAKKR
jgi:DNA-binding protein HU-beta